MRRLKGKQRCGKTLVFGCKGFLIRVLKIACWTIARQNLLDKLADGPRSRLLRKGTILPSHPREGQVRRPGRFIPADDPATVWRQHWRGALDHKGVRRVQIDIACHSIGAGEQPRRKRCALPFIVLPAILPGKSTVPLLIKPLSPPFSLR